MKAHSTLGFVGVWLLPALMLFALPVFTLWFAQHAERSFDSDFLENVLGQIDADPKLSAEERDQARAFYRAAPPSLVCRDSGEQLRAFRENLAELCSDYQQFAYSRRAAIGAIGLGLFGLAFGAFSALFAFVSRKAQYVSLLLGWNVLKVVGALETLLQGGLAVWLSFWMTAVWAERYYVKLIALAGVIAAIAVFVVVRAIFRRPEGGIDVEGELLAEAGAPELWQRVRSLAGELGTAAPDHIVVGIDDNFFVTESEVRVAGQRLSGRVLYLSLSLLRTFQRSEAEAVLAHELAHLLGGDTGHSKKLAPLAARFVHYLQALHEGGITRPIFYFMRAYYAVFELSVGRSQRRAEFAADSAAARVTSAQDIARSLLKVGAYASFRGRVEEALFGQNAQHTEVDIASRVSSGFASYARTDNLHIDLVSSITPHPFDSHPPLSARIANVGSTLAPEQYASVLIEPVASSWADAVVDGPGIETRLWTVYEERFAAAHALALAYRYQPANELEQAHVEKYFPARSFEGKEGARVEIDFRGVRYSEWETPIDFGDIKSATLADRLFKKYLDLKLKEGSLFKSTRSVCLSKLNDRDGVVEVFNRYYGRHQVMVSQQAEAASAS